MLLPIAASAAAPIDVRGDWDVVSVARGVSHLQTLHIVREDFVTGAIGGTDTAPSLVQGGAQISGRVSGNVMQLNTSEPGYTSTGSATISGTGTSLSFIGTFTDSQSTTSTTTGRLVRVAYRDAGGGNGPVLSQSLRALNEVSFKPVDLARSAVLAAGLMVLIGFPGSLFNSTLQAHYDEVMGWFAFLRRRRSRTRPLAAVVHRTNGRWSPHSSDSWL